AFGLAVFALCWADLRETNHSRSSSIDAQFRAYPELLSSGRFWSYALCLAFSAGAFFAFLAGAPLAAGTSFGLSPAALGLGMGSITAGFMFGSFLSGRFAGRVPLITMILAGRILACVGMLLGLTLYALQIDHIMALFGPCMLVGVSNGLTIPSANAGAISAHPRLTGSAAGLASAITVAGGATMASIASAVLTTENARYALFLVMLGSAVIALAAALAARHLDRAAQPDRPD
ncbi:MAG: MFS transporter, partial [Nisaea sp.]